MKSHGPRERTSLILKICISWLVLILVFGFILASRSSSSPVSLVVLPEVPRTEEPIVATFEIRNPEASPSIVGYQLYINGNIAEEGTVYVDSGESAMYRYAYTNPLKRGEQVNFVLKTSSESGSTISSAALPAYPPQLMSSFVSFAAFSTSVMSSMISAEYFTEAFGVTNTLNIGIIITAVLVVLLIFLELTQIAAPDRKIVVLSHYRIGIGNLASILFVIFIGIVFTNVAMILAV